jgi:hypothetical protein
MVAAGGTVAAGGMVAAGGATPPTGGAGGASSGTCTETGGLDPTTFPECPSCVGEPAHCVPTSVVDSTVPGQSANLTPCDPSSVCVPDVLISTLGNYAPPTCTSIDNAMGRCLSTCIGAIAGMESFLPQDTCADGEKCAPCLDPRTGESSGACTLPCDTSPTEPSVTFDACCDDGSGLCVPPEVIDPTQAAALGQDTCAEGRLCTPAELADATFSPVTCTSVAGAEGRCLSTCVELVSKNSTLLPQDVCADGELCAPCTDPRSSELTGACSINGDAPTEDPIIFDAKCCADTGLCVPSNAVPDKYSSLLPVDSCASEGSDWVCAPVVKLNDIDAPLPSCTPSIPGPDDPGGACVPQCIADKQIQDNLLTALGLAQQDCDAGWICAPCQNPLDGTRTGACD